MSSPFAQLTVAVLGSVNLDIVARVQRFPEPGETISDARVDRHPGGKGGNQALAAHRLGADVFLVACVGDDSAAAEALAALRREGVRLDYCRQVEGASTGLAIILVSAEGENQIIVAPGANAAFTPNLVQIPAADALIAQLEVPVETILRAVDESQGFFCLNAAPARPVPAALLERADLVVVNEIEARALGSSLDSYTGLLAVTLGSRGAELSKAGQPLASSRPPAISAVDSTGAGDAFTAALTVGLVSGLPPQEALDLACRAGAICATRAGAQNPPSADELLGTDETLQGAGP